MKAVVFFLSVLAVGLVALASGLRPDAFYAGDPGVKLIATHNALQHPAHPFDISLPAVDGQHLPHVEGFFAVHGDHAHAVTSGLFPILSAPFVAALGLRGAYILPAVGFLLTVITCVWLALALDSRRSALAAAMVAAFATPWLFYALELWEHTLALAAAAAAITFLVRRQPLLAGLLFGVASLIRPEAAWFLAASLLALPSLRKPAPFRQAISAIAGALLALLPFELYIALHFGTLVPPHLAANAGLLTNGWLSSRLAFTQTWFGTTHASLWRVAPALVCVLFPTARGGSRRNGSAFLWMVAVSNILLVLLTVPNDGGAQWGPRYLLFTYIPLTVLAADAVERLRHRGPLGSAVLVLLLAAALWTGRAAYRDLRGTKMIYGQVVDFVSQQTPPGGYVVTDIWWLDQVAAVPAVERRWLFVADDRDERGLLQRLSDSTIPMVTAVHLASRPARADWLAGTCYFEEHRELLTPHDLIAIRLRHRCGSGL